MNIGRRRIDIIVRIHRLSIIALSVLTAASYSRVAQSQLPPAPDHIVSQITPEGLQTILKKTLAFAQGPGAVPGEFSFVTEPMQKTINLDLPAEDTQWGSLLPLVQVLTGVDMAGAKSINIDVTRQTLKGEGNGSQSLLVYDPVSIRLAVSNKSAWIKLDQIRATTDLGFEDVHVKLVSSDATTSVFRLSTSLSSLSLEIPQVKFCESAGCKSKTENVGILKGLKLKKIVNTPKVKLSADIELKRDAGVLSFRLKNVKNNLNSKSHPSFSIQFEDAKFPPITLTIGDTVLTANPEVLRQIISEQTQKISDVFFAYLGRALSGRLADRLQTLVAELQVPSAIEYRPTPETYKLEPFAYLQTQQDNLRPELYNRYAQNSESLQTSSRTENSMIQTALNLIRAQLIRGGGASLSPGTVSQSEDGSLRIEAVPDLRMRGQSMLISSTLGHGSRVSSYAPLANPVVGLPIDRHFTLALSEPLLNGALELAQKTGILNQLLQTDDRCRSFSEEGLKIHFVRTKERPTIVAVANIVVDVACSNSFGGWWEGVWGGKGKIEFPLQITLHPEIFTHPITGHRVIRLKSDSPLVTMPNGNKTFVNSFGYPLHLPETSLVKNGFFEELEEGIIADLKKPFEIDLEETLVKIGWPVAPLDVRVEKSGHVLVSGKFK